MLKGPTMSKLRSMRLTGMTEAWAAQLMDPEITSLSFDERFGLLVDAEALYRDNNKLTRLLRGAKLRISSACVEDLDCSSARGLERDLVRQLMTRRWLQEHLNLLITGLTGTGKTYVACALGQHACRNGLSTLYRRLALLLQEFTMARATGTYTKLLRKLSKVQLLVIDDWGLATLDDVQRRDLLELFDARYDFASTIITSQPGPGSGSNAMPMPMTMNPPTARKVRRIAPALACSRVSSRRGKRALAT